MGAHPIGSGKGHGGQAQKIIRAARDADLPELHYRNEMVALKPRKRGDDCARLRLSGLF